MGWRTGRKKTFLVNLLLEQLERDRITVVPSKLSIATKHQGWHLAETFLCSFLALLLFIAESLAYSNPCATVNENLKVTLYIVLQGKKIKTSTLSTKTVSFLLLHLGREVHTRHIHDPNISVPKECMKECFLGMSLCFWEKCYDNLLFVIDYTIRKVLLAVCRLMKSFTNSTGNG